MHFVIVANWKSRHKEFDEGIAKVTSTSDQFCHGETWQYPQKSVDIATSKCFFSRGKYFIAIEKTSNLCCKSDNVLYFVRWLSRRYIHTWPSLYPRRVVTVSMPGRRCIHAGPSLYPRLWNLKKNCRHCIHGYNCLKKNTNAIRPIPCGSRS